MKDVSPGSARRGGNEPCLFRHIAESTACPFAPGSKVTKAPPWRYDASDEANFQRLAACLHAFCDTAQAQGMHGFSMEIGAGSSALTRLDELAERFASSLAQLDRLPGGEPLDVERVQRPGWQWRFAGLSLFLNVFAACYPASHPRHLHTDRAMVVFAQPGFSFDLCNANTERVTVKAAVRRQFERRGQPYDGKLVDAGVDSLLYVMPVRFTDPPVRWFDRYPAGSPGRASP